MTGAELISARWAGGPCEDGARHSFEACCNDTSAWILDGPSWKMLTLGWRLGEGRGAVIRDGGGGLNLECTFRLQKTLYLAGNLGDVMLFPTTSYDCKLICVYMR